jgi:hypothetical protein
MELISQEPSGESSLSVYLKIVYFIDRNEKYRLAPHCFGMGSADWDRSGDARAKGHHP